MHWTKAGVRGAQAAWKSFPLLMRTDVWGQHLLALGPSRDIPSSFARDGNLTPFSMTFAFLASCEDHASLVLKWSSCSLLWSSYYSWVSCGREIALLLIFVDLVSRVGGMGANFFFRNALD